MEELLANLPGWVLQIPVYFTGAVLVATVVARFTPTPEDDKYANKAVAILCGILQRFPTLGVNPQTQRMKAALEALEKK